MVSLINNYQWKNKVILVGGWADYGTKQEIKGIDELSCLGGVCIWTGMGQQIYF